MNFTENWFNNFKNEHLNFLTKQIKHTLHTETVSHHDILIVETLSGKMLFVDNNLFLSEQESFIEYEMMVHPAMFTHPRASKIALIGECVHGLALEILKHSSLDELYIVENEKKLSDLVIKFFPQLEYDARDPRLKFSNFSELKDNEFDIIFLAQNSLNIPNLEFFNLLKSDGILVQPCDSPFNLPHIKKLIENLEAIDFHDVQIIHYLQPSYPTGLRGVLHALKQGTFRLPREKVIFNKTFSTKYYNYDIHKASLVLPEFIKTALPI